ncbi:MAG: diaminopimelate decarboxylase [Methylococcales bacterium]
MDYFSVRGQQLYAEDIAVAQIAEQFGTPCYVYSKATLERHWNAFDNGLKTHPHLICYAVKANSNLAVLNVLARLGSGFDIVSIGELERVLKAGGDPDKIVFSGVGKRNDELLRAMQVGIRCFNVEVVDELDRINQIAKQIGRKAPVSIRVNPDVDPKTHPYISTGLKENKFGIDMQIAAKVYQHASQLEFLDVVGMDCHIGSQLTEIDPFIAALDRMLELVDRLQQSGINLHHLDLGGGLGIRYDDEQPPTPDQHAQAILSCLAGTEYEILLEPGRAIAGNAGILVTKVEYLKQTPEHRFAIVDAAMNDLLRPSLYSAWHDIVAVNQDNKTSTQVYDIVGPVCETGDFLGKQRTLAIAEHDLLAIRSAGAYGFTMSSNYNSRPRSAEVMVDGDQVYLIRERETISSLWDGEHLLP